MLRSSPFHYYSGPEVALINMMEADVMEGDLKVQSHWAFPLLLLLGPLLHTWASLLGDKIDEVKSSLWPPLTSNHQLDTEEIILYHPDAAGMA